MVASRLRPGGQGAGGDRPGLRGHSAGSGQGGGRVSGAGGGPGTEVVVMASGTVEAVTVTGDGPRGGAGGRGVT